MRFGLGWSSVRIAALFYSYEKDDDYGYALPCEPTLRLSTRL